LCDFSCRRSSLDLTLRHAQLKQEELRQLKEGVKQLSPASETSCHEAVSWGRGMGAPPLPPPEAPQPPSEASTRAHHALHLASDLDSVVARIRQTVDAISKIAVSAPRMRIRLAEYFAHVSTLKNTATAEAAGGLGWALAACCAELGCDVRGNASTLSDACEKLAQLAKVDAAR
jgi:hypothetical protein